VSIAECSNCTSGHQKNYAGSGGREMSGGGVGEGDTVAEVVELAMSWSRRLWCRRGGRVNQSGPRSS
jgi:hypothetical protein